MSPSHYSVVISLLLSFFLSLDGSQDAGGADRRCKSYTGEKLALSMAFALRQSHSLTVQLCQEQFVTTENDMPLSGWDGFGNLKGTTGYITRDWEWMDYSQVKNLPILATSMEWTEID
eukprot:6456241-Amphidinium_carterae.1